MIVKYVCKKHFYFVPNEEVWISLIKLWEQNFSDSDGTGAKKRGKEKNIDISSGGTWN